MTKWDMLAERLQGAYMLCGFGFTTQDTHEMLVVSLSQSLVCGYPETRLRLIYAVRHFPAPSHVTYKLPIFTLITKRTYKDTITSD